MTLGCAFLFSTEDMLHGLVLSMWRAVTGSTDETPSGTLQTTLVIHAEVNYTWKRSRAGLEQRFYQRKKETQEFGISSHAQLKPRELMITLVMVAWTANPTEGEQQLESVLVQNQTTLAVNTFRLKVQRKLLMICVGPKKSACPRSQGQNIYLPLKPLSVHLGERTGKSSEWIQWLMRSLPALCPYPF